MPLDSVNMQMLSRGCACMPPGVTRNIADSGWRARIASHCYCFTRLSIYCVLDLLDRQSTAQHNSTRLPTDTPVLSDPVVSTPRPHHAGPRLVSRRMTCITLQELTCLYSLRACGQAVSWRCSAALQAAAQCCRHGAQVTARDRRSV